MSTSLPSANLIVREHGGQPFYEVKFRYQGMQVKRASERPGLRKLTPVGLGGAGACRRMPTTSAAPTLSPRPSSPTTLPRRPPRTDLSASAAPEG